MASQKKDINNSQNNDETIATDASQEKILFRMEGRVREHRKENREPPPRRVNRHALSLHTEAPLISQLGISYVYFVHPHAAVGFNVGLGVPLINDANTTLVVVGGEASYLPFSTQGRGLVVTTGLSTVAYNRDDIDDGFVMFSLISGYRWHSRPERIGSFVAHIGGGLNWVLGNANPLPIVKASIGRSF